MTETAMIIYSLEELNYRVEANWRQLLALHQQTTDTLRAQRYASAETLTEDLAACTIRLNFWMRMLRQELERCG